MENLADIGVFGGSGFYKFLDDIKEVQMDTPYGMPSDSLFIGKIGQHRELRLCLDTTEITTFYRT